MPQERHARHLPSLVLASWALLAGCSADETKPAAPANDAPTACFQALPPVGTTETLFTLDASCSSDRQDSTGALLVRWDWENDGVWDTDWTRTKLASHRYPTWGPAVVRVEVRDTGGLSATAQDSVDVAIDYLGQTPPGLAPQVFAPGIVSTGATSDYACTFSSSTAPIPGGSARPSWRICGRADRGPAGR
jgi:hypothetical protein